MNAHEIIWAAASPLWTDPQADRTKLRQPSLLRFKSDSFMDQLFATLDSKPEDLKNFLAPNGGDKPPLKLFQPIHGHFHLVAASLVCQLPGLPDHTADPALDKVYFVLRRLHSDNTELAWVPGKEVTLPGAWTPVADVHALAPDEEALPLFPGNYVEKASGRRRRLLFGLVPTSSRETFQAAVVAPASGGSDGETIEAPAPDPVLVPKLGARAGALYVIRCVYRKPRCEPLEPPILSDPSEPFMIAAYFDPDAPARDIRIALPTSQAQLESARKSVGLMATRSFHAMLNTSVAKIMGMGAPPPPPPDPCPAVAMPTFSIPALTVVAMVVIMIISALLGLAIKICLPIKLEES
jgi:hypothetical protein